MCRITRKKRSKIRNDRAGMEPERLIIRGETGFSIQNSKFIIPFQIGLP
jgi:hypothetical protein